MLSDSVRLYLLINRSGVSFPSFVEYRAVEARACIAAARVARSARPGGRDACRGGHGRRTGAPVSRHLRLSFSLCSLTVTRIDQ
eukprot:3851374-Prymnesium_polylepis.1